MSPSQIDVRRSGQVAARASGPPDGPPPGSVSGVTASPRLLCGGLWIRSGARRGWVKLLCAHDAGHRAMDRNAGHAVNEPVDPSTDSAQHTVKRRICRVKPYSTQGAHGTFAA